MKNYIKPNMDVKELSVNGLASLNDWLNSNDLSDAGITTFIVNS